jgi:hypothetical protein
MAHPHFTQAQCDALTRLTTEKRYESDGTTFKDYWVRLNDENGTYYEFADEVSASNASVATRKTNAHAFLIANCEFLEPPVSTVDDPEDLLA